MAVLKPAALRQQAEEILQNAAYSPKKLILLHTAVSLGIALLITALNFFLSQQIAGTGGLSGLGLRTALTTAQSVLEFGNAVAMPFWEIGLLFAMLCWMKGVPAGPGSLLQGFRKIGQVLMLRLAQGLLFFAVGMGILQFCLIIYLATPLSTPIYELIEPLMEQGMTPQQIEELLVSVDFITTSTEVVLPLLILFTVLFAAVAIPLYYRIRFAEYSLMDDTRPLAALVHSTRITKKNCLQLLKLDLSFWWYYLLQLVCIALCYGDMILPLLNITLPFSAEVAFFLFFLLGSLCQGLLLWQYRGTVLTTYGAAYRQLWQKPPTPKEQNLPYRA